MSKHFDFSKFARDADVTLRSVNNAIKAKYPGKDITLYRSSAGYYYFSGENVKISASGVYVYNVNQLSISQWLAEAAERFE